MADGKFVELVFEPGPVTPARSKSAYQSLARNPHQLFALLLKRGVSTEFFSGFEVYGTHLARLLRASPEYFGPAAEHPVHFRKDGFDLPLLQETINAFIISLLTEDFPDIASQQSMAKLVMAVIKISIPGRALGLLGARLGEVPVILSRLIADQSIGKWSQDQPASFRSILSVPTALGSWAKTVTDLAKRCDTHSTASQSVGGWEQMRDLVRSFPCNLGCVISSGPVTENPGPRRRNLNHHRVYSDLRTFDNLLGEHLGPWKLVLSEQAISNLREFVHDGTYRQNSAAKSTTLWSSFLTI